MVIYCRLPSYVSPAVDGRYVSIMNEDECHCDDCVLDRLMEKEENSDEENSDEENSEECNCAECYFERDK